MGLSAAAAAAATKQLQNGISPGVRASGPFAKQIAQVQAPQRPQKRTQGQPQLAKDPRILPTIAAAMR